MYFTINHQKKFNIIYILGKCMVWIRRICGALNANGRKLAQDLVNPTPCNQIKPHKNPQHFWGNIYDAKYLISLKKLNKLKA